MRSALLRRFPASGFALVARILTRAITQTQLAFRDEECAFDCMLVVASQATRIRPPIANSARLRPKCAATSGRNSTCCVTSQLGSLEASVEVAPINHSRIRRNQRWDTNTTFQLCGKRTTRKLRSLFVANQFLGSVLRLSNLASEFAVRATLISLLLSCEPR